MSDKERKQAKVFELLKEGKVTQQEAAARLGATSRWVRKKMKRYLDSGDAGLLHQNRGRSSPLKRGGEEKTIALNLLNSEWREFGPTFSAEKLEELHGITVNSETMRTAMIEAGLWKVSQRRSKHRSRRERRPMVGMMVQLDGSPHE